MEKNVIEEQPLSHYVCTGGCKFISDEPGKCHSPGCVRARNPLTLCTCTDNTHGELLTLNSKGSSH